MRFRTPKTKLLVASLCLLLVMLLLLANVQNIFDWVRLQNFHPDATITGLADRTTMTAYGRKLFYVYHAEVDSKATFNSRCTANEQSIVLGCYVASKGIYLLQVTDPRLNGVEEVTAAHEMLHAAYQRLTPFEQKHIDTLTAQALSMVTDQRIKDTIAAYRGQDPSVVPNELHSVLGTEDRNLPPELETYYKKYFTNRQQIVNFSDAYEAEFTRRKTEVEADDAQLKAMKSQIDTHEQSLASKEQALTAQKSNMDSYLASKQYAAYNAGVDSYNAAVRSYNTEIATTKQLIDSYNALVQVRNAIAIEQKQLVQAIDSRSVPAPVQ